MSDRQESAVAAPEAGPPKHDHPVLRRVFRVTLAVGIGVYFVASGAFLGLRYVVLPRIDEFRPRIERAVSDKLHAQLSIGRLSPHWSGMQPGVEVTNLTVRGRDGRIALSVPHATAALSWISLLRLSPALSSLIVDHPDLVVARAADGSLSVAGIGVATTHGGNDTFGTWLLKQEAIVLRNGTLRWRDAQHDAPELALSGIRLAVLNHGREHKVALQAPANGTLLLGPLDFRARFTHKPLAPIGKPTNWTGNAYLSTGPVDLQTLGRYLDLPFTAHAGRIDNAIWATFQDGHLRSVMEGDRQAYSPVVSRLKIMSNLDIAEHRIPQDGRMKLMFEGRDIDFRVSILPTQFGEKVVMRILDKTGLKLDFTEMGFEPEARDLILDAIKKPNGIC
ncbi:MAG: Flp pilus assembly complex ATPase component TadA, partial [Burkholderia vietnamiensis]|nr:Flp pilus assembly complex ATPase component TadA [Burkholderia vietnamiensis]